MKVKVVKPFKDKYTRVIYGAGQEIEIDQERFEELTSAALGPFVKIIGEKPAAKREKPVKTKAKK